MGSINIFDPNMAGLDGLSSNKQGGFSQAATSGVNLETGQPIARPSLQQMYQGQFQNTINGPQFYQAPGTPNVASGGTGGSNSDAFFNSANAPMQTGRTVSVVPNGASAGAGYNTALLNNLISAYKTQTSKANTDSVAQHADLMKSVGATTDTVNGLLSSLGKGNEQNIATQGEDTKGRTEQDLISRGLGNTTVRSSMLAGVDKNTALAQAQNASNIAAQKISAQMNLSQMYGDALLSRQNVAPGNDYLQLISQIANRG